MQVRAVAQFVTQAHGAGIVQTDVGHIHPAVEALRPGRHRPADAFDQPRQLLRREGTQPGAQTVPGVKHKFIGHMIHLANYVNYTTDPKSSQRENTGKFYRRIIR